MDHGPNLVCTRRPTLAGSSLAFEACIYGLMKYKCFPSPPTIHLGMNGFRSQGASNWMAPLLPLTITFMGTTSIHRTKQSEVEHSPYNYSFLTRYEKQHEPSWGFVWSKHPQVCLGSWIVIPTINRRETIPKTQVFEPHACLHTQCHPSIHLYI